MDTKDSTLLIYKIIGFFMLGVGIVMTILFFSSFGDFDKVDQAFIFFSWPIPVVMGIFFLLLGFRPWMPRGSRRVHHVNNTHLHSRANTYCSYCGAKMDRSDTHCKQCGAKQR